MDGGPRSQYVTKAWSNPLEQAIVAQGYILFEIDNRGSANRGVAFEKPLYRAMGGVSKSKWLCHLTAHTIDAWPKRTAAS